MIDQKTKIILALEQVDNVSNLVKGNQWEGFFASHLLPIKYELGRQLSCLTNAKSYTKIEE